MKQVFIDPTSKNCMFTSLEPQGSFLFHRFGKRDIPEEHIDLSNLINYLETYNPDQIILESVFGDPLEYIHIEELLLFCKDKIQVVCITNGFSDNFSKLDMFDIYYIFKVYSFTDTSHIFYPENNFEKLLSNLKYCNKVQYNVYKENLVDVSNIYNYSDKIDVEFVKGPLVHVNINHIITEQGKWLYDVCGLNEYNIEDYSYETLSKLPKNHIPIQSMEGYHLLKNYVKPPYGESILNATVYKMDSINDYKKQTSISFKGHLFDSVEERNIITNTYITDWHIKSFKTDEPYQKSIISIISNFANSKKLSI